VRREKILIKAIPCPLLFFSPLKVSLLEKEKGAERESRKNG
jgi:hypothetical protein